MKGMKTRPTIIAFCVILAFILTLAFVVAAIELGRYSYTDIYIGTLWSFILLSIFFLSTLPSKIGQLFQRRSK